MIQSCTQIWTLVFSTLLGLLLTKMHPMRRPFWYKIEFVCRSIFRLTYQLFHSKTKLNT